jgi:hypothetical protein
MLWGKLDICPFRFLFTFGNFFKIAKVQNVDQNVGAILASFFTEKVLRSAKPNLDWASGPTTL